MASSHVPCRTLAWWVVDGPLLERSGSQWQPLNSLDEAASLLPDRRSLQVSPSPPSRPPSFVYSEWGIACPSSSECGPSGRPPIGTNKRSRLLPRLFVLQKACRLACSTHKSGQRGPRKQTSALGGPEIEPPIGQQFVRDGGGRDTYLAQTSIANSASSRTRTIEVSSVDLFLSPNPSSPSPFHHHTRLISRNGKAGLARNQSFIPRRPASTTIFNTSWASLVLCLAVGAFRESPPTSFANFSRWTSRPHTSTALSRSSQLSSARLPLSLGPENPGQISHPPAAPFLTALPSPGRSPDRSSRGRRVQMSTLPPSHRESLMRAAPSVTMAVPQTKAKPAAKNAANASAKSKSQMHRRSRTGLWPLSLGLTSPLTRRFPGVVSLSSTSSRRTGPSR